MSIPAPPSFESFFNNQQPARQSSSDSNYDLNPKTAGHSYQQRLGPSDQPINEEPRPMSRRDSGSSGPNRQHPHGRDGSGSSVPERLRAVKREKVELRQDSIPFDPMSSSTLISTAADSKQTIVATMFPDQARLQGQQIYSQQPGVTPFSPSPQPFSGQWSGEFPQGGMYAGEPSQYTMTDNADNGESGNGGESYLVDQSSPYASGSFDPQQGEWGNEFFAQGNGNENYGDWNGESTGMLGVDDTLAELERIMSNSQAGSHAPSRENTPFQPDNAVYQGGQNATDQSYPQAFDSAVTSRSTSPHPANMNIISPPLTGGFHRGSPSSHPPSPFFNKPQSPPALIIPNQQHSPSPVLPPIITSAEVTGGMQAQQQHGGAGLGGVAGGLFPPANPALEGLTGMAGISPIAPNADGPMIYIQPSTPISGLKDGRGVFDFKRVTQGQQVQQSSQQQMSQSGGQLSRHSSVEGPDQLAPGQSSNGQQDLRNEWQNQGWSGLRAAPQRPRAKSDSQMGTTGPDLLTRQAFINPGMQTAFSNFSIPQDLTEDALRAAIDNWRITSAAQGTGSSTLDPRSLPGQETQDILNDFKLSQQFAQLQAQRSRLPPVNTSAIANFKTEAGQFSPTSLAFYASMGLNPQGIASLTTSSAPFFQSTFPTLPEQWPQTAGPTSAFLMPEHGGLGPRRRSFAEGMSHPAAGAGTPGYGVEFTKPSPFGTLDPGVIRGGSASGHRRAARSEDLGRPGLGTGWGVGAGGSTADFLTSITANDGTLLPPSRGRSHSRQSSASSVRSASPALSISSQGSSYSHTMPRMDMPEGVQVPPPYTQTGGKKKVAKLKVTSVATEVASASRRTNDGVFHCPIPGCGSTFTRHFNLKGHLRSHNDERPYKCLYDGCPKATVGFARQHDCKRHMLLHEGLRPFECEGCGKKFARLDALTRHHKSEQGQECAISHPLPTNPDGSQMSESQYKAYRAQQHNLQQAAQLQAGSGGLPFSAQPQQTGMGRRASYQGYLSGDDRSIGDDDVGNGSGMEDYDRF